MARRRRRGELPWGWILGGALGLGILMAAGGGRRRLQLGALGYSTSLGDLHPELQPIAELWLQLTRQAGLDPRIRQTARAEWLQRRYVQQGTSQADWGWHIPGLAFDFDVAVPGLGHADPVQGRTSSAVVTAWRDRMRRAGALGKQLGMVWGGDWSTRWHGLGWDPGHLEYHPRGLTLARARAAQERLGYGFPLARA